MQLGAYGTMPRMLRPTRRWSTVAAALLSVATLVSAPVPANAAEPEFTFVGGGWGHSAGMSQYGAYGMSRDGAGADEIIAHFYEGASVATVDPAFSGPLWVNVSTRPTGGGALSAASFTVLATGATPTVPVVLTHGAETVAVAVGDTFSFTATGSGQCELVTPAGTSVGGCSIDGEWDGWAESPTTMIQMPGCANTAGPACRFARGSLRIRPAGQDRINVSLEIAAEAYTLGIAEMPYGWGTGGGMAALEAQAIAARSYALRAAFDRGVQASCACHVYATTVDQSYVGYGYGHANWIAAVRATEGKVVTHPASTSNGLLLPIKAYYSSSTYGWTESFANAFGLTDYPWLQPVDDHWSRVVGFNPNARWSVSLTGSQLAAALNGRAGVPPLVTVTRVAITRCSDSGAALGITFWGEGNSVEVSTRNLRAWLGLKSMQVFNVGAPPPSTPPCPSPFTEDPAPLLPGDLVDSIGLHDGRSGSFTLHVPGGDLRTFYYGDPRDVPFTGDWDCDGVTTLGLYRTRSGYLFLRNTNSPGFADVEIFFGNPGDIPIAGDWDGDGCETVGIYRPSEARFYLRNSNTAGFADIAFTFGDPGDVPLAGDWDGDGVTTVGVYRPSTRMLYLANVLSGAADVEYAYGGAAAGDIVIVGDWNGDDRDTVGVFRPATATFYLRDGFSGGADYVFQFGNAALTPISGRWA